MNHQLFLLLLFVGISLTQLSASETALSALQTLHELGRPQLAEALVEIKGEHGEPQPQEWILLCNDPQAQSGIRELIIKDHHPISERTPLRRFEGEGTLPQLDLKRVSIDSGVIFKAANTEAKNHRVGFDFINYILRTDALTGQPLWVVQLYKNAHNEEHLVGTLQFSTETGALLKSSFQQ